MTELLTVDLNDKYSLNEGRIFLTGIQALVRLPILQRQRDAAAGLNTAGYITGYRGSPLGAYDQQLQSAQTLLDAHHIKHQPGVNEDLAATACSGTQQVGLDGESHYDGVFAIWYSKGPGVDRSGDALRHGNLFGTAQHGGVLCLLGDDHTCESSTTAHQSEYAMVDAMIPVLNPAGVKEIFEYGLLGIAMSRFSGAFVALKCVHETVESTASINFSATDPDIQIPSDYNPPPDGLNIRWPDDVIAQGAALAQERRLQTHKLEAARAFARANKIDRILIDCPDPKLVIATTGKAYLDVLAALDDLQLDADKAASLGLRLYKVGLTYPLEPQSLEAATANAPMLMVIEEKRGLIEEQAKSILYDQPNRPAIIGKADEFGAPLFPAHGDLNPNQIAVAIASRLLANTDDQALAQRLDAIQARIGKTMPSPAMIRTPYFCAGCPHNSSTRLPEGSKALAGIGCHYLVQLMDDNTRRFTQMGGEGASWIGEAPFSTRGHIFQNIGDGTYYHSGSLAIRAAVAAKVNVTFKILFNDAVAMTGGQKMETGNLTVPEIAADVAAEGVSEIHIVTDEPYKYPLAAGFPSHTQIHHRDDLDKIQRRLRTIEGVTVLIYDQTCAAEKRRRRKRGRMHDPDQRVVINEQVCEGCGDCGVQSNCVAIHPVDTELGRKRRIDQSACNKDFSCLKGFCPSFVTVHGGKLKRQTSQQPATTTAPLPAPTPLTFTGTYNIVVTGIGGTGVVTIAALIGMAAHLEQKEFAAIDMIGLAQKGGAVVSHMKIGAAGTTIGAPRVAPGQADLVLGCDLVVTAGKACLPTMAEGRTRAVVNLEETMPGAFTQKPDLTFPSQQLLDAITDTIGSSSLAQLDASKIARTELGDAIGANLLVVGYAFQQGLLPLSAAAIERAIEINGVAVPMNKAAFETGRRLALSTPTAAKPANPTEQPLTDLIDQRARFLTSYQDAAYARRYRRKLNAIEQLGDATLTRAAAHNLFKLMAIKDEYEVARLFSDGSFISQLKREFDSWHKLEFHLAPPLLSSQDENGKLRKQRYGPWMLRAFTILAKLRTIRGRWYDPFGHTAERKMERQLLANYEQLLDEITRNITPANAATAIQLAELPAKIRGFGHVKEANIIAAKQREAELLATFRQPQQPPIAAE